MATGYTDGYSTNPKKALYNQGAVTRKVKATVSIASGDNDGDVKILAFNLPVDTLVSRIMIPKATSGITGATDYDIGFYEPSRTSEAEVGSALDKDALADGIDFSSSVAVGDILGSGISSFDPEKTIGDLLSLSAEDQPSGVHLCLTLNTAGTADGSIDMDIELVNAG